MVRIKEDEKLKVLVVCQANLNRSPTVAKFLSENFDYMDVKSAGTYYGYPNRVNKELLEWADVVYVMDLEQYKYIVDRYEYHPKILPLAISDQYDPDDPKLIELLEWYFKVR